MRKRKKGRKLNRKKDQRNALWKSLAAALILKEKVKTTEAKAKEVSSFVEKKITKAKAGNLASRRFLSRFFTDKVVKKLVDDLAVRFKERKGGYTRIIKLGQRKADAARMVIIELIK